MRRRNTAINAIQSLYDENVELKQKLDLFTKTETNKNHPQPEENRFAIMCYNIGVDRIMEEMDYRLRGEVVVNKDGTYPSYEQWLERILTTYRNPFDGKLLREFSVNELVRALEPRLRQKHKEEVEKKRLNDLKKE